MSGPLNRLPGASVVSFQPGLTQDLGRFPRTHTTGAACDDGLPLFLQRGRFGRQRRQRDVSAFFAVPVAVFARRSNIDDDSALSQQFIGAGGASCEDFFQPSKHLLASVVNNVHAGVFPPRDARFKFDEVRETHGLKRLRRIL